MSRRTKRTPGTGRTTGGAGGSETQRFERNLRFLLESPAFEPPPTRAAPPQTTATAMSTDRTFPSARPGRADDSARERLDAAQTLLRHHGDRLAALDAAFAGMTAADAAADIAAPDNKRRFPARMEALGRKDRKLRLEGSQLMTLVINPGNTAAIDSHRAREEKVRFARRGGGGGSAGADAGAGAGAGGAALSVRTARHNALFFREDRNRAKTRAVGDHARTLDKAAGFGRTKGDIIGYGNFAQFQHISVQNHVNLGASGHG